MWDEDEVFANYLYFHYECVLWSYMTHGVPVLHAVCTTEPRQQLKMYNGFDYGTCL
jgi:hypothetical protein